MLHSKEGLCIRVCLREQHNTSETSYELTEVKEKIFTGDRQSNGRVLLFYCSSRLLASVHLAHISLAIQN